jgi:hypothetical protein
MDNNTNSGRIIIDPVIPTKANFFFNNQSGTDLKAVFIAQSDSGADISKTIPVDSSVKVFAYTSPNAPENDFSKVVFYTSSDDQSTPSLAINPITNVHWKRISKSTTGKGIPKFKYELTIIRGIKQE